MLEEFLQASRLELTTRCRTSDAARSSPARTRAEFESGSPILLDQLVEMLRAEQPGRTCAPAAVKNDIERSATKHGGDLLRVGVSLR